jgi:outer membrane receptor protein involved in Fe transport
LTEADLALAPSAALDDTLRTTPGFGLFRRNSSRVANPTTQGASLRGLAASGASRALVLADGIPLNDPFGGWVYWNSVPHAAIDRVEVVRGGASDLYGADALAGVVQILTARPATSTVRLLSEGDTNGTATGSLFSAWRHGGTSLVFAGEGSRSDGFFIVGEEERGAIDTHADVDYLTGAVRVDSQSASGWRVRAGLQGLGESRRNGTPLQANDTSLRRVHGEVAGPVAGGLWELAGQAGDQVYHQSFSAIGPGRNSETLTSRQNVPASDIGFATSWRRLFGSTDFLVGADLREIVATNRDTSYLPTGAVRAVNEAHGFQRSSGVYAQLRAPVGDRTTVVAGVRGDLWQRERDIDASDGVLSPRVSASFRLSPQWALHAAASRSFRAPTLNERIRPFRAGNSVTLANLGLRPEELATLEGGVLFERSQGSVRATVFTGSLDDAVTNVTLSTTPELITRQRQNAGGLRATGLEAEGDWRVLPELTIGSTLAWTRSRFTDTEGLTGNDVPQVPRWAGDAWARWSGPVNSTLQAQLRWFGDQFEDDRNTLVLRGAALVDLSATAPVRAELGWYATIENLFDVDYDTGRTPTRTIGTPRTLRVGLRYGWK